MAWAKIKNHSGELAIASLTILVAILIIDTDIITVSHVFELYESEPYVGTTQTVMVKSIPANAGDLVIVYPQAHDHESPYGAMELFVTESGQAARYRAGQV